MCGRHVTHTVITGHKHAFYRKYMDRRNEPLPRLYRKYAQMMHTMPLSERGKKFREKIPLFSCQGRICTFLCELLWIAHTRRRNYAVSRKLLRRLFSFFHKRCTLSHWVSVRKYTGKKHNIFEKNAFLCHVWQTCDTYRNNWSQTCVLQEVYGQTQWTAPAFVQEVCANDAHYATEWAWEKEKFQKKNMHFF